MYFPPTLWVPSRLSITVQAENSPKLGEGVPCIDRSMNILQAPLIPAGWASVNIGHIVKHPSTRYLFISAP